MTTQKTVLFGERAAGVYRYEDIYIYDEASGTTAGDSGKIVPAVGSLVIGDSSGSVNRVRVVTYVNPDTLELTLMPITYVEDWSTMNHLYNYGNDLLMLYFSKTTLVLRTNNTDVETPVTRLIVDNKLSLFGNTAATYILRKQNSNGSYTTISKWYQNKIFAGSAVPMLDTGVPGVRKCDGCYTDLDVNEGDTVLCEVYSTAGMLIGEVTLIAKKAHFVNDVAGSINPIVDMEVTSNQQDSTGIYLIQGQEVDRLSLYPVLIYSNGSILEPHKKNMDISKRWFIYGLENISTDIEGQEYTVLTKYYLGNDDIVNDMLDECVYFPTSDTAADAGKVYYSRIVANTGEWIYTELELAAGDPIPDGTYEMTTRPAMNDLSSKTRWITKEITVRILGSDRISKVSLVPIWNNTEWVFKFLVYYKKGDISPAISEVNTDPNSTHQISITTANNEPINGALFGTGQACQIYVKNTYQTGYEEYTQSAYVTLRDPTAANTVENYRLAPSATSTVAYGRQTGSYFRPRIWFAATPDTTGSDAMKTGYFIPASVFTTKSRFQNNFYTYSSPPTYKGANGATLAPTHFVVKTLGNARLTQQPIAMNDYSNVFLASTDPSYVGKTVIVEFINYANNNLNGTETILFGVPVEVIARP